MQLDFDQVLLVFDIMGVPAKCDRVPHGSETNQLGAVRHRVA